MPDIDIDFADRSQALEHFKHVTAAIKEENNTSANINKHTNPVFATFIMRIRVETYTNFEFSIILGVYKYII